MQLEHSFTIPVGVEEAWRLLADLERSSACVPGATVESVDGAVVSGTLKIKLASSVLTYAGEARVVERDAAAHRAVLEAQGRDGRVESTVTAKITAVLTDTDGSTTVEVVTDVELTGRPAQLGRTAVQQAAKRLIAQFASRLAEQAHRAHTAQATDAEATASPATAAVAASEPRPRPKPTKTAKTTPVATAAKKVAAPQDATADAPTKETTQQDAPASADVAVARDAPVPDLPVPDLPAPDLPAPDAPTPDTTVPDVAARKTPPQTAPDPGTPVLAPGRAPRISTEVRPFAEPGPSAPPNAVRRLAPAAAALLLLAVLRRRRRTRRRAAAQPEI